MIKSVKETMSCSIESEEEVGSILTVMSEVCQSALLKFHFEGGSEEGGWEEMWLIRIGK